MNLRAQWNSAGVQSISLDESSILYVNKTTHYTSPLEYNFFVCTPHVYIDLSHELA